MPHLAEAVRARLREEVDRQKLSQRDLAGLLGWSQSRVGKVLTGRVELGVDELEALCLVLNVRPTEMVRDRDLEFSAEMTPLELAILQRFRRLPKDDADAYLRILRIAEHAPAVRKSAIGPGRRR